jgi:hypothetical protein
MPRLEEATAALEAIAAGKAPQEVESATLDFKEQGRSEGDALKTIADAALCAPARARRASETKALSGEALTR